MAFFVPRWTTGQPPPRALELHENGTVPPLGGELNLPIGHRFGLRGEVVWKRQHLRGGPRHHRRARHRRSATATLEGIAGYGELWFWLLGDDRLLPAPGPRSCRCASSAAAARLRAKVCMLAVRGEFLKEDLTSDQPALGDPTRATTRVVSGTAGVNYWRGAFVRISVNYVLNSGAERRRRSSHCARRASSSTSCCSASPPRSDIQRAP